MEVKTESILTCPVCKSEQEAEMPINTCQHFYKCQNCGEMLKPKDGDYCVFCSYADTRCPSKQNGKRGGDLDGLRQTKNIHMPYASGSRF